MLELLLKKIKEDKIINYKVFNENNIDRLLDLRDEEIFDSEWIRAFSNIEKLQLDQNNKKLIDEIREEIYLKTYYNLGSDDIASCISDDFELISKYYILGINNDWVNSIIYVYSKNKFPCGKIDIIKCDIKEIFSKILE